MSWRPGDQVGPYRVERRLGQGGMGAVYLAQEQGVERLVALKVVCAGNVDPELELRLRREAQALAKLTHPHVLRVLSLLEREGRAVLVTEFVEGETLAERVKRVGPLPVAQAVEVTRQCAEALSAAHDAGVLHRDLKPENVMLGPDGVKVMDFGIARDLSQERLTQTGDVLGTPGYMPPEALRSDPPGPWSDVFGIGGLLYFLLSGRAPFEGRTRMQVIEATVTGKVQPLVEARPDVPGWVAEVCARALEPTGADRPSARELADALALGRAPRSAPRLAPLLVALGLAVVGPLGVLGAWRLQRSDAATVAPPAAGPEPEAEGPAPAPERTEPRARWPGGTLEEGLCAYEPWVFVPTDGRLAVCAQGPTAPELACPLLLGRGPWEVEVAFSRLNLGVGSSLSLFLVSSAALDEEREGPAALGWSFSVDASLRLNVVPEWSEQDPDTGAWRRARVDPLPLETDPRGPLRVSLGWRDDLLELEVRAGAEALARRRYVVPEDALPGSLVTLRVGQLRAPLQAPSVGKVGTLWSMTRCEFELEELEVRAAAVTVDDARDGLRWGIGRAGWGLLTDPQATPRDVPVEVASNTERGVYERWATYAEAMRAARQGDYEEALRKLVLLWAIGRSATGTQPFSDWRASRFWLRNRLIADLPHYPPELRGRLGAALVGLEEERAALETSEDPELDPEPKHFWGSTPAERREHAQTWAVVQFALHQGQDTNSDRWLSRSGLLEEAWLYLQAEPGRGAVPDLKRMVLRGWTPLRLGLYGEALRFWSRSRPTELPAAAWSRLQRYADEEPRAVQPPWARK